MFSFLGGHPKPDPTQVLWKDQLMEVIKGIGGDGVLNPPDEIREDEAWFEDNYLLFEVAFIKKYEGALEKCVDCDGDWKWSAGLL